MADAFRGLTLRIGADARPLQSAISSISRSASQAQKQMNRLNRALNFDSSNVKMMQSRIDIMGDKALHSARAFAKIKTAMQQAATEAKGFNLRKLAAETKDAYSATEKLRSEYNHVDAELQHIYDAVGRVVMRNKELANADHALAKVASRLKGFDNNDALDYVRKLREQMKGTGDAADKAKADFQELAKGAHLQDAIDHVKKLKEQMKGLGPEAEAAAREFKRLAEIASSESGINELFGQNKGDVEALLRTLDRLIERHKKLHAEYDKMDTVQGYRAMAMEARIYEAEVRQAASETARLNTEMHALGTKGALAKSVNSIKLLGNASEKAVASAHQMIDAYRKLPSSLDRLKAKASAVAEAESTLAARMGEIKNALRKLESDPAFDKIAASTENAYVSAMKVENEYTELATKLSLAEGKADELRTELNTLNDSGADRLNSDYRKVERQLAKAEEEARQLKTQLNSLDDAHATAALIVEQRRLRDELAKTEIQVKQLHTQMSKLTALGTAGKSLRQFGFGMYASLTPAAMMAGNYMIQSAEDIDAAYRNMRKTVNGTEEDFQTLLDHAIEFSTTHVTTADQILEIEAMGGQLGIQVENLESFAHTVSNLDIATNMEADDIATQLGKMATVMGMSEDQYDNFGDALVRLGNNMPVMEGDIMNLTNRFMGMAKVVGMSPDQMLGWAAAASATGQKAEAAGSSMLRFISNMETAVNSSDEDLQKWADVTGMSVSEFRKAFDEDASGTMYRFVQGLGEIQKSGGSVNQVLRDLGINNVRDKQLLEGLANQMANGSGEANTLAQCLQLSSDAWNGLSTNLGNGKVELAGDAMREADKKSEGFSGSIQKLRNQAAALMNELAEGAQPIVNSMANTFGKIAKVFQGSNTELKTFAIKMGLLTAAVGPATVGLGTFLQSAEAIGNKAVPAVKNGLVRLGTAVLDLGGRMGRGGTAVMKLGNAIGLLGTVSMGPAIAGIAAVGGAIYLAVGAVQAYINHVNRMKKATEGTADVTRRFSELSNIAADDLSKYSEEAGHTSMTVDELAESVSNMVDAQNARAEAAETEIGKLSAAQQIIEKYANTDLSGNIRAQGELRAAVDMVNDICGTQLEVLDSVNGKLSDEAGQLETTTAALSAYIEEKKNQIRVDAISESLAEVYEKEAKAFDAYVTARTKANQYEIDNADILNDKNNRAYHATKKALDELNETADENYAIWQSVNAEMVALESNLGDAAAAMDSTNASIYTLAKGNANLQEAFSGMDSEFEEFASQLDAAGMTMDEFYNLTSDDLANLVIEWSKNGHDMNAALESIGLHARSLSEQYQAEMENLTGSTESWQAALDATGMTSEEFAKTLQASGISAAQFASIGGEAFGSLYNAANGDIPQVMALIDLLNAAGIDPKEVDITVDENGIMYVNDQILTLNESVARIGDRKFKIDADGNFEELREQIDETEVSLDEFEESFDEYGEVVEEAADGIQAVVDANAALSSELSKSGLSIDEFGSFVESMGVSIDDLANSSSNDARAMVDAFETVSGAAEKCGMSTDDMAAQVAASGISFDTLAGIGSDAFARIYESCNGDMELVKQKIDEYNRLPFEDKKNFLKSDASDATAKIDSTNKKPLNDKTTKLSAKDLASASIGAVNRLYLNDHTTYLYARDHASAVIDSVKRKLNSIGNVTANIFASSFNAAGGIAIPKHGDGGFGVATGPTLTSAGWVGEDGWEAIVPLTNRRYVRPFAQAVASEVHLPSAGTTFNITVNASGDGEDIARALRREMSAWLMTQKAGA